MMKACNFYKQVVHYCPGIGYAYVQYMFLLVYFWQMSEQILSCADMSPNTFQSVFHALYTYVHMYVASSIV